MSTLNKATNAIRAWQKRHESLMDKNPDWSAQNLAGDLDRAGLLAPQLPEPDRDARDPEWQSEYEENYEYSAPDVWHVNTLLSVAVFPKSREVTVWDDGEPLEPLSIVEARKFAYSLLAAADKAETDESSKASGT